MRYVVVSLAVVIPVVAGAVIFLSWFCDWFVEPTPLMSGFASYATLEEVMDHLPEDQPREVRATPKRERGSRRPPSPIVALDLPSFQHLGFSGKLSLFFFKNRLMSTWFYPSDPEKYLMVLRQSGVLPDDANEASISPFTRVWTHTDIRERVYVGWGDSRLLEQHHRWLLWHD
jgi:hypothetical protein